MPSDASDSEFTEFQLEEIAMGRAQEARRRLAARATNEGDPVRDRLAQVRDEIESIQNTLTAAGDDPDVRVPGDELLAGYLDGSLPNESREKVERALAGSAETRRRLIEMYQDVRACTDGESLPGIPSPIESVVPYAEVQPSERKESAAPLAILIGGLAGAALCWGGAIVGPAAWRTPLAFAAVGFVAMIMMHRFCALKIASVQLAQRRVMQSCLVLITVVGVSAGVLNAEYVPVACSTVVAALIVLFASVYRGNVGLTETANPKVDTDQTRDVRDAESRRHGAGRP